MIGLWLLAAHMVGDFITQNQWMADNKLRCPRVRAFHVTVYTLGFVPVVIFATSDWRRAVGFLLFLWAAHFVTDSRRWASGEKWPAKPLMVDQTIHIVTLAVLGSGFEL